MPATTPMAAQIKNPEPIRRLSPLPVVHEIPLLSLDKNIYIDHVIIK
jgi:hypothetical protein